MFRTLVLLALIAMVAAFAPSRFANRASSSLCACRDNEKDQNGRCPGETGYTSFVKPDPGDWKAVKAAQDAKKKAAAEAAAKK